MAHNRQLQGFQALSDRGPAPTALQKITRSLFWLGLLLLLWAGVAVCAHQTAEWAILRNCASEAGSQYRLPSTKQPVLPDQQDA